MYKQYIGADGNIAQGIMLVESKLFIPANPDNTDYQAYLKWVTEGNTPLPAENE